MVLVVKPRQNTGTVLKHLMCLRTKWIFPLVGSGFENCGYILSVEFGSVSVLDSGDGAREGGLGVMSYCCDSSPPLRRRNLLHREQAQMNLRRL